MSTKREDVSVRSEHFDPPEPKRHGELIVWHWHDVWRQSAPGGFTGKHHYRVNSVDEAKALLNELIDEEKDNEDVMSNAFGLLVSIDNPLADPRLNLMDPDFVFEEWEDDTGDDIMDVIDAEHDEQDPDPEDEP